MAERRKSGRLQSDEQSEIRQVPQIPLLDAASSTSPTDFSDPSWLKAKKPHTYIYTWVLPPSLSQSQFAGRQTHSSACTLIAVSIAKIIHKAGLQFPKELPKKIPDWMLHVLGNAMQDGNAAHDIAMKENIWSVPQPVTGVFEWICGLLSIERKKSKLEDTTFTVPEAINALGGGVHEIDVQICDGPSDIRLAMCVLDAISSPHTQKLPIVYLLVIMLERAILVCFDRKAGMVLVFDSHSRQRAKFGAVIAMAPEDVLRRFCVYVRSTLFPEITNATDRFEISCLQVLEEPGSCSTSGEKSKLQSPTEPITARVFRRELARGRQ